MNKFQVRCPGNCLLPYSDQLIQVLDRALQLKCREGYQFGGAVLNNLLRSLSTVHPTDYRSIARDYDQPLSEYLPIRDWGKPGDINNLQMKWHVPNSEERAFATTLVHRYLTGNIATLEQHVNQTSVLPREVLHRTLSHVLDCILGSGSLLPPWKEQALNIDYTSVSLLLPLRFSYMETEEWEISSPDGENIRFLVAQTVCTQFIHFKSIGSIKLNEVVFNVWEFYFEFRTKNGPRTIVFHICSKH